MRKIGYLGFHFHFQAFARTSAALGVAVAAGLYSGAANAQLAAAFTGKIDVDTAYVSGAAAATDIAFSADGRALVTTKSGQVWIRRADGTKTLVAGQFGTVDTASEKGLLGVVAHPDEATNHTFFFYVSNGTDTLDKHHVVTGVLNADNTLTVALQNPIIAAARGNGPGLEGPQNHDGGGLFIHKGQLYIGVGDTGHNTTPPTNRYASCLNKGNGKILRVGLDGSVPSDNPLVGVPMVTACATFNGAWTMAAPDTRIFAWGLRNPWRFWIDPLTDLLWIGDVGEVTKEEVDIGTGNQHYGYPFVEGDTDWRPNQTGTLAMDCPMMSPSKACSPPVHAYAHLPAPNNAAGVIGGLIPSGCGWNTAFGGKTYYVFGDSDRQWVRLLEVNAGHTALVSTTPVDLGTFGRTPASFRMGPDQALYAVFNGTGAVYRFAPTDMRGSDCGTTGSGGASAGGASGGGASAGGASGGTGVGGANGTAGAGGAPGSAGTSTAGSAGLNAGNGSSSGGCGCRMVPRSERTLALLGAGLALVSLSVLRKRKRR